MKKGACDSDPKNDNRVEKFLLLGECLAKEEAREKKTAEEKEPPRKFTAMG